MISPTTIHELMEIRIIDPRCEYNDPRGEAFALALSLKRKLRRGDPLPGDMGENRNLVWAICECFILQNKHRWN